jgi:hypothetical protein
MFRHMVSPSATAMRDRQLEWARAGGIPTEALEVRHEKVSWVLKSKYRKLNLFRPSWWDYIEGSEHRWARALNSSQCFAVNLFAPLKENEVLARKVLQRLLPERSLSNGDSVLVDFEITPAGSAAALGERGQATQVDVFFQIKRSSRSYGYVLVEVKFSETSFGRCRGWASKSANPMRARCIPIAGLQKARADSTGTLCLDRRVQSVKTQLAAQAPARLGSDYTSLCETVCLPTNCSSARAQLGQISPSVFTPTTGKCLLYLSLSPQLPTSSKHSVPCHRLMQCRTGMRRKSWKRLAATIKVSRIGKDGCTVGISISIAGHLLMTSPEAMRVRALHQKKRLIGNVRT